jgi:hypothetical protein
MPDPPPFTGEGYHEVVEGAVAARWRSCPRPPAWPSAVPPASQGEIRGQDKPGHDGLVGMCAPDKEPARRRRSERTQASSETHQRCDDNPGAPASRRHPAQPTSDVLVPPTTAVIGGLSPADPFGAGG